MSEIKFQIINCTNFIYEPWTHQWNWLSQDQITMNCTWSTSKWDNNKHTSSRKLNITKSQLIATLLKVLYNIAFPSKIFTAETTTKLSVVPSPSVPADIVSILVPYRIALDIDYIHKALHLHVEVNATRGYHSHWISFDKCYTSTKYLHCVTLSSCGCPVISLLSASVFSWEQLAANTQYTSISSIYHYKLSTSVTHSQRNVFCEWTG